MFFENFSIGTDIEEIERFNNKTIEKDSRFLNYIFTNNEIAYCFSKKFPQRHLCARFCGKEAVVKALYGLGIEHITYKEIEILNKETGLPYVNIKKIPGIKIKISLSLIMPEYMLLYRDKIVGL